MRAMWRMLKVLFVTVLVLYVAYDLLEDEASVPLSAAGGAGTQLKQATVYLVGDDGGGYELGYKAFSSTSPETPLVRGRHLGTLESSRSVFPLRLEKFDEDGVQEVAEEQIDVSVKKSWDWEGNLMAVLAVNGRVVECANNLHKKGSTTISFDPADPEQYRTDYGCWGRMLVL